MKEEARFQIRGTVRQVGQKSAGQRVFTEMIVTAQNGYKQDAPPHEFEVAVWDEGLADVARAAKGRQALILGRVSSSRNAHGYCNARLVADAVLVEPAASPHGNAVGGQGSRSAAPAPQRGQAGGQQQAPQSEPEYPLPWEENVSGDDIPF